MQVGGHCDTWTAPDGGKIDTGVEYYQSDPLVLETFQNFGVGRVPTVSAGLPEPLTTIFWYVNPQNNQGQRYTVIPWDPASLAVTGPLLAAAAGNWTQLWYQTFAYLDTANSSMPNFDNLPPATLTMLFSPFGQLFARINSGEFGTPPRVLEPLLPLWNSLLTVGPGPLFDVRCIVCCATRHSACGQWRPLPFSFCSLQTASNRTDACNTDAADKQTLLPRARAVK